ncbi:hypothetical protein M2459_000364 [Parabacteroides sp. PF5-5]|nr:hypothetical protein [Parabacteroides sp. PH5-39]MDH6314649.1 hypothetical protein [Parabacteroides sp. PF5-13]MDH6321088.1 hypothetical protein [Parabacteroides sp. PH5-13]MDH6324820.1 hypothetical protein [Parabacteroides sp. PH5-8]MDH6325499.1 hypothetical protein [Parabacteroides sp. PH5-41]MDH6333638.1 hypothetical protein [Parabacteroides sp. PF5-5]MDH6344363.1 hypothetical protein [Parabacteroides sp. PH5-46]MDH6359659.1 hypothetical protein [Parabacteroides sp. PH5-16]MDH6375326.
MRLKPFSRSLLSERSDRKKISVCLSFSRIFSATSKPFKPGILMSNSTRSGFTTGNCSTAIVPFPV